jgi:hypothetical protein
MHPLLPAPSGSTDGVGWTVRTVGSILSNPRYTGRQVRNRQRTDTDLIDPADVALGHRGRAVVEPA